MIQVRLSSPAASPGGVVVEDVDEEIISVAGCTMGFILPGQPPHVLSVDPGSPTALQGVLADDMLVAIDGHDTHQLAKAEARRLLSSAARMDFKRPGPQGPLQPGYLGGGRAPPGLNGSGLAGLALGLAMPKAAASALTAAAIAAATDAARGSPEAMGALPKACPPEAAEAVAAMSAKAPPQLATALGFFSSAGPSGVQDVGVAYQKASASPDGGPRWGKGPFDKGGKGEKGKPGKQHRAPLPLFVPPPPGIVPPAALGGCREGGAAAVAWGWCPGFGCKGGKAPLVFLPALGGMPLPGSKGGPRIVLPPALTSSVALPPDPGEQPESLPPEHDHGAWLELLRDGFGQQFRCENEWQEPPPFHRALHFAAPPGDPVPAGKYPREGLNMQLQLLFKARTGMGSEIDGPGTVAVYPPAFPHGV